jgi:hypothetical protein
LNVKQSTSFSFFSQPITPTKTCENYTRSESHTYTRTAERVENVNATDTDQNNACNNESRLIEFLQTSLSSSPTKTRTLFNLEFLLSSHFDNNAEIMNVNLRNFIVNNSQHFFSYEDKGKSTLFSLSHYPI